MREFLLHIALTWEFKPPRRSLQSSWDKVLSEALTQFRQLSSSTASRTWKPVASNAGTPSIGSAAAGLRKDYSSPARSISNDPSASDAVLHKRSSKNGDIFRAVLEVPLLERDWYDVEIFKGLLQTPETITCCESVDTPFLSNEPYR